MGTIEVEGDTLITSEAARDGRESGGAAMIELEAYWLFLDHYDFLRRLYGQDACPVLAMQFACLDLDFGGSMRRALGQEGP